MRIKTSPKGETFITFSGRDLKFLAAVCDIYHALADVARRNGQTEREVRLRQQATCLQADLRIFADFDETPEVPTETSDGA